MRFQDMIKTETELTRNLVNEGIHVIYRDDVSALTDGIDMVIYIRLFRNPFLLYLDLKVWPIPFWKDRSARSLSRNQKILPLQVLIWKTTTSLLVAHILYDTGIPMTAFLGGIASNHNNNFLQSGEDWFVLKLMNMILFAFTPDIAAIGSLWCRSSRYIRWSHQYGTVLFAVRKPSKKRKAYFYYLIPLLLKIELVWINLFHQMLGRNIWLE